MYTPIAVIDIGSNSVRLVIYQQLDKQSFYLIDEHKFKVRIGEGAYLQNGYLQENSIHRAYNALKEFSTILKQYPTSKLIVIATSALRDAPNSKIFTNLIKKELNLEIKIINGQREAYLGALAAKTLLPIKNAISIDIGGGSSDIALIQDNKIIHTYSLNLGTVRLKELFSKKNILDHNVDEFIFNELKELPDFFTSDTAIGIGGTARTLSKAIMRFKGKRLSNIHNFTYQNDNFQEFFNKIITADNTLINELKISKNRIDTIREGTLIWKSILNQLKSKEIISSAVGLREGAFLEAANLTTPNHIIKFTNLEN